MALPNSNAILILRFLVVDFLYERVFRFNDCETVFVVFFYLLRDCFRGGFVVRFAVDGND